MCEIFIDLGITGSQKVKTTCPKCKKDIVILVPESPKIPEVIFDEGQVCKHCNTKLRIERRSSDGRVTISSCI